MEGGMKNPRQELGREKLLERIREFALASQSTILHQVKKMGTSCDWSRLAFTFDEPRSKTVNELFCRMYRDGLIYRGYRVVNWSVKGQSTCSDDEVVYVERPAKLYTFNYGRTMDGKKFPINIATTRPETKLGDTAVAVHPNDERYQEFVGKTYDIDFGAREPLHIKIIADENVDKDFGTGAIGVTPAHSSIDFEMYEKQKAKGDPIGLVEVIGLAGRMTEEAGQEYQFLTVEEAREKLVARLRVQGLLEKEEEIIQNVGTSDRFGDVIEAIPMSQWWLDVKVAIPGSGGKSLKDLMREAVTTGLCGDPQSVVSINPDRYQKLYLDRIDHLRDWCLSRQIWWGHRIPVWYLGGEVEASSVSPGPGWEQDPDTLDTWFSSGAWTFSTLGWPDQTTDMQTYHPTQWIQMGYEIVYLWMMRMILMSAYALNQIPFKDVYIHGILRDEQGKKFSKSSGNNIDPLDIIQSHGCDALRWSVLIGTTPGNDSRFYEEKVEGARNLVNKLWNVSRYMLTTISGDETAAPKETLTDRWIQERLSAVTKSVTQKLEAAQFSAAGEELREFTWNDLADWYLEIAKVEKGKRVILDKILRTLLSLWHPFTPFVTEYIWKLAGYEGMVMVAPWPTVSVQPSSSTDHFLRLQELVTDMRRLRAEQHVEPSKRVTFAVSVEEALRPVVQEHVTWMQRLTQAEKIDIVDHIPEAYVVTASGHALVGLDVMGVRDVDEERKKLTEEIVEVARYLTALEQKLANQEFVDKAPAAVVEKIRRTHAEMIDRKKILEEKRQALN